MELKFPADQMTAANNILTALINKEPIDPALLQTARPVIDALQSVIDNPDKNADSWTIITDSKPE